MEDVRRVVLTSTISAVGTANGRPADEENPYPEDGLGLVYADAKRGGEREAIAAGERLGVEVVVVNPAYVLGVPVDTSQPGETSTRIVGNYLRGRLPAVLDAAINFVDVADVATGHLLAADKGKAGERYILGGHNRPWAELIDMVAHASGVRHPLLVVPAEVGAVARLRERLGLPGAISAEAFDLMGQDWRFTSAKAKRELGYRPRPLAQTISATTEWYLQLIEEGAFDDARSSPLSVAAEGSPPSTASGSCGRCDRLRSCCDGDCSRAAEEVVMGLSYAQGLGTTPLLGETIAENFDRALATHPERDALVVRHQDVH